jgi:hypothetical protein
MASSFLIMKPDVPEMALVVTVTAPATFDQDYPLAGSFNGAGHNYARLASAQNTLEIVFDLGTGNTRAIDHFIIGGVKSLRAIGVDRVLLQASTNGTLWFNQLGTTASFLSKTLNGPNLDTVIFTPTYNSDVVQTAGSYRYFKVIIQKTSGGVTIPFSFSKLYFGAAFDMDKEPDNYDIEALDEGSDTWKYPRGHTIVSKAFYPRSSVTIEWDGVTDAKSNEFLRSVLSDPYRGSVYLYTEQYKDPLFDNTIMFCKVMADDCSITKDNDVDNWNDIVAVFEEAE